MKKVFLDCGAHVGESIQTFRKFWNDWQEYEIHSFEANPNLASNFDQFKQYDNINFHSNAVWIKNGPVELYIDSSPQKFGSSLNTRKHNLTKEHVTVNAIDIAEFILQFDKSDYIILKLDIEGSEYDVIPHLIQSDAIMHVNELYLEFHSHKVGLTPKHDTDIINSIKEATPSIILYTDIHSGLNFRAK